MTMFTMEQQLALLSLARTAVETAVTRGRLVSLTQIEEAFAPQRGVFVTLTAHGDLRGCIGFPEPIYPLHEAITRAGYAAALEDPRFNPVTPDELPGLRVEVSVLSPLAPILPDAVEVGVHGLVIEHQRRRGLLLPQVPVEYGWTRDEFLTYTCRKAGLPLTAWQDPAAKLFGFTAEVFHEQK